MAEFARGMKRKTKNETGGWWKKINVYTNKVENAILISSDHFIFSNNHLSYMYVRFAYTSIIHTCNTFQNNLGCYGTGTLFSLFSTLKGTLETKSVSGSEFTFIVMFWIDDCSLLLEFWIWIWMNLTHRI